MNSKDEAAFPETDTEVRWDSSAQEQYPHVFTQGGLSKRELFAAMAMQGICSARDEAGELIQHGYQWVASESVKIADALLVELAKEKQG